MEYSIKIKQLKTKDILTISLTEDSVTLVEFGWENWRDSWGWVNFSMSSKVNFYDPMKLLSSFMDHFKYATPSNIMIWLGGYLLLSGTFNNEPISYADAINKILYY